MSGFAAPSMAPIGMALVSRECRFLQVNPAPCDILGYSETDLLARMFREVTAPAEPIHLEYRFIARDGRTVWVQDVGALNRDDDGVPWYWQGFLVDITEHMLAKEELRAATDAAEEASHEQSVFLPMATYELRTPLTTLAGYSVFHHKCCRGYSTSFGRRMPVPRGSSEGVDSIWRSPDGSSSYRPVRSPSKAPSVSERRSPCGSQRQPIARSQAPGKGRDGCRKPS